MSTSDDEDCACGGDEDHEYHGKLVCYDKKVKSGE